MTSLVSQHKATTWRDWRWADTTVAFLATPALSSGGVSPHLERQELLVCDEREDFARISLLPAQLRTLLKLLGSTRSLSDEPIEPDEIVREVLEACRDEGLVVVRTEGITADQETRTLDLETLGLAAEHDAIIVGCSERLVDTTWLDLEESAYERGFGFLPVHGEFGRVVFGPLKRPAVTEEWSSGYRDARFRRLAAHPAPNELAALWAAWDGTRPPVLVDPVVPSAATVRTAAGMIHDLLGTEQGRQELGRFQYLVHPSGELTRHPVLPMPNPSAVQVGRWQANR